MSGRTDIRIGRLVLPPGEAGRSAAVGTAVERSLAARLEGQAAPAADGLSERIAAAVARRIESERR